MKGTNSTRINRHEILDAKKNVQDMFPTKQVFAVTKKDMFVFATLGDTRTNTLYTDLIGRLSVESYNGINHIFVAYVYILTYIILRAMNS